MMLSTAPDAPMAEPNDDGDTLRLVERAATANERAWTALIARHRGRLRQMIAFRMDRQSQSWAPNSD